MIVIEDRKNQIIRGVAHAIAAARIPLVLWNPISKSSYDMCMEQAPELVMVSNKCYQDYGDELEFAKSKFKFKLMVIDTIYTSFANIVSNLNSVDDNSSKFNAIICNDCEPKDSDLLKELIYVLRNFSETYRIYGQKILVDPYYVGEVNEYDYKNIYRNAPNLIDLHGDHVLNSELFGNKSHFAEDVIINPMEFYYKPKVSDRPPNNIRYTANLLHECEFVDYSNKLLEIAPKYESQY